MEQSNKTISNSSKKRCREFFGYKGIGKLIESASSLIENNNIETIVSEFLCDYDNVELYNVLLFFIRDNNLYNKLDNFNYIEIES